jgi:syntaxin-binding protein 5
VATFKILPSPSGRYSAQFSGVVSLSDDRIVSISPIDAESGSHAYASGNAVAGLHSGRKTTGALVVTTASSAHIFRPASAKGASKTFDQSLCDVATVARFGERGYALIGLFSDGNARAYSLPGLKEVGHGKVTHVLDLNRLREAIVTGTGDIFGWTGPSEMAMLNVWGAGLTLPDSPDRLFDPAKVMPPRPTISNLQWISGTQYITPTDMDIMIGGPGRPPSKRMIEEMRVQKDTEYQRQREAARTGRPVTPDRNQEGYWAYMQRQIQERTENLGFAESSIERTADTSENFSDGVSKFVAKQKRQAALGLIGSKLGF